MSQLLDHAMLTDLMNTDLSRARFVVLNGVSGCGKSTSIRELLSRHPDYRDRRCTEIRGGPIDWCSVRVETQLIVVDEMLNLRDVGAIARLLLRGHRVLAASHLHPVALTPLRLITRCRSFCLDADPRKISAWLDTRGLSWSEDALARFHQRFAGSFTDAKLVAEYAGGDDFDHALDRFTRYCEVRMTPQAKATSEIIRIIAPMRASPSDAKRL